MNKFKHRRLQLGLNKRTINIIALALCVVVIGAFLYRALVENEAAAMYDLANTIGLLFCVAGIALFLEDFPILGLVLQAVHIAQIIVYRVPFSMEVLSYPFLWFYMAVFLAFAVIFFVPSTSRKR